MSDISKEVYASDAEEVHAYFNGSGKETPNDPVNHPSHYTDGKIECVDYIEDKLGYEGFRGFCLGNALKYISRSGKKDPAKEIEDIRKAIWYLNHYVEVNTK